MYNHNWSSIGFIPNSLYPPRADNGKKDENNGFSRPFSIQHQKKCFETSLHCLKNMFTYVGKSFRLKVVLKSWDSAIATTLHWARFRSKNGLRSINVSFFYTNRYFAIEKEQCFNQNFKILWISLFYSLNGVFTVPVFDPNPVVYYSN